MIFNPHYDLKNKHAFLGASKYSWIRYDEDKLIDTYRNFLAVQRGTMLHDFACQSIKLGIRLPRSKKTLNMYVNDAIGFGMTPEQSLYYSRNCFGTADAICFEDNKLRIHDLKTGVTPASMDQLLIYAALFCLEYDIKPIDISVELRIYQNDDIQVCEPTAEDILLVMGKIVKFDKCINKINVEEGVA